MSNHPHRSTWRRGIKPPSPDEIRASRDAAGLTQEAAARLIGLSSTARWGEYEIGMRMPTSQLWELWLLLVDQHPALRLARRRGAGERASG